MRGIVLGSLILSLGGAPLAAQGTTIPTWSVTLGAGVFAAPRYPGSDETRILPVPIVGVEYKGRVFLGATPSAVGAGLGVNLIRSGGFTLTAGLGGSDSRPNDRADALAGMEDRGLGFAAVSGISYQLGPLQLSAFGSRGLNDGAGWSGQGSLGLTVPVASRVFVGVGGSVSLADAASMRYDFGVTGAEAARRSTLIANGDPRLQVGDDRAYRPSGGVREVGANANLAVMLSPRWTLFGFGGMNRLSDEAASSPLVRQRTGWSGGVGFSVRR